MADLLAVSILIAGTIWKHLASAPGRRVDARRAHDTPRGQGGLAQLAMRAVERHETDPPAGNAERSLEAVNGSLVSWKFFSARTTAPRVARQRRHRRGVAADEREATADIAGLSPSNHVPAVQTFLDFAHVPFMRIERDADRTLVLWSDLRDCSATACDLSFGAAIDHSGKPISEVIRIGTFEQIRLLPPG